MTNKRPRRQHPFVGRWFHTFDEDGYVQWQGKVLAMVSTDLFLVQLYDWLWGDTSDQKVIPLSQMTNWTFYDSDTDMKHTYDAWHRSRAERRAREHGERVVARE